MLGWRPVEHETSLPLASGDKDHPDVPLRRKVCPDTICVGLMPSVRYAGARIKTPLQHFEAIVFEPLAEVMSCLALRLRSDWKIKCNYEPAHFVFVDIQGR